jgi:serine/threonine protein phosphatase 1
MSYGVNVDISSDKALERSHAALSRVVPESHLAFLRTRQFAVSTGDFFFCHAGIRPQVPLDQQNPEDLIWIRGEFLDYTRLHPKIIVHGHTISESPEILPNRVNVDTGAYRSGELTAFVVDGTVKRVISVLSRARPA